MEFSKGALRITGSVDLGVCLRDALKTIWKNVSEVSYDVADVSYTVRFLHQIRCAGSDLSAFHRAPLASLESALAQGSVCADDASIDVFDNVRIDLSLVERIDDTVHELNARTLHARMTGAGAPCTLVRKDGALISNECTSWRLEDVQKSLKNGSPTEDHGKASLLLLVSRGLRSESAPQGPWFAQGGFDVSLDGWEGGITFDGSKSAPRFALAKSGLKIRGALNPNWPP